MTNYIITPHMTDPEHMVKLSKDNLTLKQLQALVGGYIEIVRLPENIGELIINENGKIEKLPVNPIASMLYRQSADPIVGTVVYFPSGIPKDNT